MKYSFLTILLHNLYGQQMETLIIKQRLKLVMNIFYYMAKMLRNLIFLT